MKRFIFSIAIMSALILGGCSDEEADAEQFKIAAFLHCQDAVKKRLKAPSTAKFPRYERGIVYANVGMRYTVNSYVDSQNGFGAMLRTNYTCELEQVGLETWKFIDLQID